MDIHLENNDLINIGAIVIISSIICTYGCCMYNSCRNSNTVHINDSAEDDNVELTEIKIKHSNEPIKSDTIPDWAKREYLRDKNGKKKVFT
tara:strand:+ start:1815 stop:2087 length:273 start_codon:yes stop_codon:yes gene_type:complete